MTEHLGEESGLPSEPVPTLGEQLKFYRGNNRLSQAELARRIGVTPSAVNHWEKDRVQPSQRRLKIVQEVLGLPSEDRVSLSDALAVVNARSRPSYMTISLALENSPFPLITQVKGNFDENDLNRIGTIIPRIIDAYLSYKTTITRIVAESFELQPTPDEPTLYG